eukprot:m.10647 g.10647  ORF g.10647 m.10647 type:complete len:551 (-) comp3826_c0_seq2:36-1688(-)
MRRSEKRQLAAGAGILLIVVGLYSSGYLSGSSPESASSQEASSHQKIKQNINNNVDNEHNVPVKYQSPPPPPPSRRTARPAYVPQIPAPPDVRHPSCAPDIERLHALDKIKPLPNTSVIFCFCNEPKPSLHHSLRSVIERSPRHLLHEIVLVDDGSNAPHITEELQGFVATLPVPVKIVRQGKRTGLMQARNAGARAATGETLTFLDSHIDASLGWLEPLMARIGEDSTHVVMPIIDGLDKNFQYHKGGIELVGFNTKLVDHGMVLQEIHKTPGRLPTDPQPSPAMAGGLFSISRDFFFKIGAFDEQMEHWGGENIEISFRIWQCGGTLELLPCSRVAHIFGGYPGAGCPWPGASPNSKNKWRAIKVWMDDYESIMKNYIPPPKDIGNLDEMYAIRDRLQCKSFQWFLDNVYPECWINIIKNPVHSGLLRNEALGQCLNARRAKLEPCTTGSKEHLSVRSPQWFFFSKRKELILSDVDTCLEAATSIGAKLSTYACHSQGGNQEWIYDQEAMTMTHGPGCVEAAAGGTVTIQPCKQGDASQQWRFVMPSS